MSQTGLETARLEIKFVAYESETARLVDWLLMHPDGFTEPPPNRWVNNVYFDTYDSACYAENLSGTSQRTKVRYRWYGEDATAAGLLEVKRKRNQYGWKYRYKTATNPVLNGGTWRQIVNDMTRQLPAEGRIWLQQHPQPMFINRYFRQYYLSADGAVRVTIDSRQAVFDQRLHARLNTTCRAHIPATTVMEFKFDRHHRDHANRIIQGLPLRVSRHSKYMVATKALVNI